MPCCYPAWIVNRSARSGIVLSLPAQRGRIRPEQGTSQGAAAFLLYPTEWVGLVMQRRYISCDHPLHVA